MFLNLAQFTNKSRSGCVKGWQYPDDAGKRQSDTSLVCSREVSKPCSEVIVELQGEVKKKHPELAGSYKPVKGKMNRGRWVGFLVLINQTHLQNITIVIDCQRYHTICVLMTNIDIVDWH